MTTEELLPDSAGDRTEWSGQYPSSGSHWDKCDEDDGDTSYVYHNSTLWKIDMFNLTPHTGTGTINSVKIECRVRATLASVVSVKTFCKTGGSEYEGTSTYAGTSYSTISTTYETNPKTGSGWTWDEVDALQCGCKSTTNNASYYGRMTKTDAVVDYTGVTEFTVTDSGTGTDTVSSIETQMSVADAGVGSDTPSVQVDLPITDQGLGADQIAALEASQTVQDSGVGSEAEVAIEASVTITDAGTGADSIPSIELPISDAGIGTDSLAALETTIQIVDEGLGVDIAWRLQGQTLIDELTLPHVQSIKIDEKTIMSSKPIQDELPWRKFLGKMGRQVAIEGWTDSLATLETLAALDDGQPHTLTLSTGDSVSVHVTKVETPRYIEEGETHPYKVTALERVD